MLRYEAREECAIQVLLRVVQRVIRVIRCYTRQEKG